MTPRNFSFVLLSAALVAALVHALLMTPDQGGDNSGSLQQKRDSLVYQSLLFRKAPKYDTKTLYLYFNHVLASNDNHHLIAEPIVLFYHMDGEREKAEKLLAVLREKEKAGGVYNSATLAYAIGASDQLPGNWRSQMSDDWTSNQIEMLVYQRLGNEKAYLNTLVRQRFFEQDLNESRTALSIKLTLVFLGFLVMAGMLLSYMATRRLGIPTVTLGGLAVGRSVMLNFTAFFLLGFIGLSVLDQIAFQSLPFVVRQPLNYALIIAFAWFLVKKVVFPDPTIHPDIPRILGISQLRVRWFHLFQMVSGLAFLTAAGTTAGIGMELLGWPYDDQSLEHTYKSLMTEPFSAAVLLLLSCLVAPVFEEILFRGLLLRGFLGSYKPFVALMLSSVVFAMVHPFTQLPLSLVLGCCLGLIYLRTGRLVLCIWTHALWNLSILLGARLNFGL